MRKINHYDDLYNHDLTVITDADINEFNQYLKRKYKEDFNLEDAGALFVPITLRRQDGKEYDKHYIWIEECKDISQLSDFLHELLHHCLTVFENIEQPINGKNQEALCYYYGYLIKVLLSKLY